MSDLRVSFPKPCTEDWESMRPEGCNRFCARCEKTIHDLAQLTFEEAEKLARSADELCVRATLRTDGVVDLKPGLSARRIIATVGASVGLLAASGQAAAGTQRLGAIKGEVQGSCGGGGRVIATSADGSVYYAKIGRDDRFKVKRLPAGSYEIKVDDAESVSPFPKVTVEAGRTSVRDVMHPRACIIIGMLKIDDHSG